MSAGFFTACERLLSATANGVYQGILVALLAGLTLRLFARTNAATRHAVWFGVLLFVTALIPAHLLLSSLPRPEIPAAASSPASNMTAGAPALSDAGDTAVSPVADVSFPDSRMDAADAGRVEVTSYPPAAAPTGELAGGGSPATAMPGKAWWSSALTILKPLFWSLEAAIRLPHSVCVGLISAWVLLAAVRGGLIVRQIVEVRRVKSTSSAPNDGLQTRFDKLRDSLGAGRAVRLRLSGTHRTAVVLGFVHPVVLLPAAMNDINDSEVEHVLRHELAHVDRRDDWGNLTQQVIQAVLFFHPAVWWISARLSLEREIACDDHVLEASGQPRDYALTLANVAGRLSPCRHLLAPGVSNNHSQLQQRISMILNTHRDRSTRLARSRVGFFTTTTAILAVLAIGAGPRLVLAQSSSAPTPSPAPEAVVAGSTAPVALPPDQPGVESGPRAKVDSSDSSEAPEAPTPAAPAIPAVPPVPALAPDAPVPPVGPMPPGPRAARNRHASASIEARLDRIERTLEELQARDGKMGRRHGSDDAMPMAMNFSGDMDPRRMAEEAKRMAEDAKRAAEDGQRAAEDGKRDAEKAMRDLVKLKSKDFERLQEQLSEVESEAPMQALEALRRAHESLERQMQSIERQIKHLEENQVRRNKRGKDRTEAPEEGPKAEQPGEPAKK